MVAGRLAMDGFRGLHEAKLLNAMAAPIILDERRDRHMDRENSLGLYTGFTKPSEGYTRLKCSGLALDVLRRFWPPRGF
jgi:hypothetical protein